MAKAQFFGSRAAGAPRRIRIQKDDVVKVITGRDKGKTGRVLEIDKVKGRVLVEGVQMIKRHTRPNPQQQVKGGIAEREATIHISNVMLTTSNGVATRIGTKVEQNGDKTRRVRVARKTGEVLEKKK